MDTIENVYYTATIPYIKVENGYVIYSKVKLEDNIEEEIVFYNFAKKDALMCINGSMGEDLKVAKTCVMENKPYVIVEKTKGYELIDITSQKNTMILDSDNIIEYIKDNVVIASVKNKSFIGKEKSFVMVYKLPSMTLLHREKGRFVASEMLEGQHLYIMTSNEK